MSLDDCHDLVMHFHSSFGIPIGSVPTHLATDRVIGRSRWLVEEVKEFGTAPSLLEQADALIDIIYLALGGLVEIGVRPDALFKIVHQSNMTKLNADGRPVLSEDGKVRKPSNWQSPSVELALEIERQVKEASRSLVK